MWTFACVLLALAARAHAITRDQLYAFGPGLDLTLPRGQEVPSPEVPLSVPVVFYGEAYESIFVNNYGVLTFRANIPSFINSEFPLPFPSIAAFYTNVDTTERGNVYYRATNERHILAKAEESVQNNFHDYFDFKPSSVFIATWEEVTYTNDISGKKNTFQIAIISNGTESFVEFLYPDREIQWIQKETQPNSQPDAKAQAGFVAEDGRLYTLRGSGSHQVRNIISWSNIHEPGKYVFRVGNIPPPENIAVPDEYNQYDIEAEEEYKTCAQTGPSVCHMQARCVDYNAGICCQCNKGFYGNGKSCIKDDVPLRVHGKLNGNLNTVALNDVDIQAYVVVSDGRSYSALSQAPPNLGGSLQLLNVLGGVIGWLFAKPIGTAKNGYQLTGSLFNHTADIFFPLTGDRVTINQEYLGHDVFDQITLDSDVRGTVPYLPANEKLEVLEYEEQYSLVESGLIRSESSRTLINKKTGQRYEQKVSQTFTYSPCKYAPQSEEMEAPLTLKAVKNYLGYEAGQNIVRYGMSGKIAPLGEEDPCIKGRASCGPKSTCVVHGETFKCVCQPGFTYNYVDETSTCEDIDECSVGTHNCDLNADCYNHEGGFRCKCRQGFEGDGVRCAAVSHCQHQQCDRNAQCIETTDNFGAEALCVCNPGFTGDGKICYEIILSTCDTLRNCNPNADCVSDGSTYTCRCRPGFTGDGYYCAEDQDDHQDEDQRTTTIANLDGDYNENITLPHCDIYGDCVCPYGYTSFTDDRNNHLCRLDNHGEQESAAPQIDHNSTALKCQTDAECPANAICSYSRVSGNYECICLDGYEGDGYECIERPTPGCMCGSKASCIVTASGDPICVCDPGYHGDGYICRPNFSCNNNTDCEYNAECRPDPVTHEYVCQCIDGFIKDQNDACIPDEALCNGAVCAEHASCLFDAAIGVHYCYCDQGYEGEGIDKCVAQGHSCDVANDCHPDAICQRNDFAYECVCRDGFLGNGYNCAPEPTCRNDPYMCDTHASCLKRKDGYVCECNAGYFGNGSSCALNPKQTGNFLVASDGVFIYRVPFQVTSHDYATPIYSGIDQIAVGINVDCQTSRVYWGDIGTNSIKRAAYDGSGFEVFLGTDVLSPEGLAIDWAARNIFWTDPKKYSIEVANMDTRIRKALFTGAGISNPRGIAVHPARGKVFWSDWNRQDPKIEWASMDGSERGLFLSSPDVKLPNSLAIDWNTDRLCYSDAGLKTIECVNIDTRRRDTVASECSHPFGLAISDSKFYWTDWKTLKIEYLDARTESRGQVSIATASRKLFGVAVAPEQCYSQSNVCQYRNGNCGYDELCLPDGRGGRTCSPGY